MALKNVSFFIGSTGDLVNSINGETFDMTATALVAGNEDFEFVTNPNGQTDLKTQIDDTIDEIFGNFTEAATANVYNAQSNDFDGQHPKTRCPKCPAS